MRLKVDQKNDAIYFRLDEDSIVESEEVQPGIILDYNDQNKVIGVEILGIIKRIAPEVLKTLQFETV